MVLFLAAHVGGDSRDLRLTDCEGRVALLPGECPARNARVIEPLGRIRLERTKQVGQQHMWRKPEQYMSMIHDRIDLEGQPTFRLDDSSQITAQVESNVRSDSLSALLAFRRRRGSSGWCACATYGVLGTYNSVAPFRGFGLAMGTSLTQRLHVGLNSVARRAGSGECRVRTLLLPP
jgi:hypothetical protein